MKPYPSAQLVTPLVCSGLLAVAVIAGTGALLPVPDGDTDQTMIQRLFGNPFVLLIGIVGVWAFFYGLLQLWSFQASATGLIARLAGHAGPGLAAVTAQEPGVAAGLFTERWDHLSAIRMAPLSYAIWALPLLGFIGTVIGISDAIGGLGNVFADNNRQDALSSVLGALRFAFDTTFVGLVLVLPVMALATTVSLASDAARDAALADRFGTPGGR